MLWAKFNRLFLCFVVLFCSVINPLLSPKIAQASLSQSNYGISHNTEVRLSGAKNGQYRFQIWDVNVDGRVIGKDANLQKDEGGGHYKGYPMTDVDNLRDWVTAFRGNYSYVLQNIGSARSNLIYNGQQKAKLYSLSEIATLSGARGDNWSSGTDVFVTSDPPKASINTKNGSKTFKVGDTVQIHGYGESNSYANRRLKISMTGPGLNYSNTIDYPNMGSEYVARFTTPDQSVKLSNSGNYTYVITVEDGVGRKTTERLTIGVGGPPPPAPGGGGGGSTNGPQAIFDLPASAKVKTDVYIKEHSKAGDAPIKTWDWKIEPMPRKNGVLGGSGLNRLEFLEEGSFDITLKVTDSKGRSDAVTHTIYIGDGPPPSKPDPKPPEPENKPPVAKFQMPSSVKQGGTVNVIDSSYDPDGEVVDWSWSISPTDGVSDDLGSTGGTITFEEEGEYNVELTVTDDRGATDTYDRDITVRNRPPVAKIGAPDEVVQGDDINIRNNSYDPDGEVVKVTWGLSPEDGTMKNSETGKPHTLSGDDNRVYFDKPGKYTITLVAEDDQGKESEEPATKTILVKPAIPIAHIDLGEDSYPKQNRKVVFDSSSSSTSKRYPINWDLNNWEFIPPAGVSPDKIKVVNSPDKKTRTVLFKEAGDYVVRLKVTNAAGHTSEWFEFPIIIYPDLKPNAEFYVGKAQIRDALNGRQAEIRLEDKTVSPDNDIISKRIWKYRYDSNNDGNFEDEKWVILDSGNNPSPVLYTDKVGKYQFELYVEESFGQPTIPEFIGPEDLRWDDTSTTPLEEKVVEVINLRPFGDFKPRSKKKVDVIFTVANVDSAKVADLPTKITQQIETKLAEKGVDSKISSLSTSQLSVQDKFNWQEYSHYNLDTAYQGSTSNGSPTTNHIVTNGRSITFFGYDAANRKDFLFMPNDIPSKKTFDFDVDENLSSYHSLEGAGYLFNASIEDGKLKGYAVLFAETTIRLYKIKDVDVNAFRSGSLGDVSNFPMLATFPKTGKFHRFHIEVTPTQIDAWDNGEKIIDGFPLPEELGNGFGPMASHSSHGCSELTQVTFSNIKMQTVTGKSLDEVLKDPEWRDGSLRFVATLSDKVIAELNDPVKSSLILSRLLEGNLDYSVLGTSQNQSQAQRVISQNNDNGTFINNSNIDAALSAYADYILSKVNREQSGLEGYVLLGEEVEYDYTYDDVEDDPQYAQKWMYNHDPNYFQNSLGLAEFHQQPQSAPIRRFDKVGLFDIKFQIRDNPLNDDRFDNYRLWSVEPEEPYHLYVHRRPIAQFTMNTQKLNAVDYSATYEDVSYDLDHQYDADKGIVERQWKWKDGLGTWQNGTPSTLYGGHVYSVYLRVKDKEGEWSDPMIQVISLNGNLPPVANFTVTPNPVEVGKTVTYKDMSYDPNPGDYITDRQWRVQRLSDETWINYGSNPPSSFPSIGKYRIELTVTDSFGAVSTPFSQVIEVIQTNRPPVARFTVTPNPLPEDVKETYNDTSYDPDKDPIVAREWRYSKDGGAWIPGQPTDIGRMGIGVYKIQLRVKDQPVISSLTPLWSDWYEQTVTVVKGNEKPIANLVISPNPVPADEPVTWVDKSTDPEGKNLQAYDLIITQNETNVTKQFTGIYSKASGASMNMTHKFISVFENSSFPNEGVGSYTVKYRVKDTSPNGTSPAVWSDYQVQTLVVEDPLKIEAWVKPPIQKSGAAITLTSETSGRAEKVIARVDWNRDGDFDDLNETIQLENKNPIGEKKNDWEKSVIIPLPTKDGDYVIRFTAYKGGKTVETVKSVKVLGDVYDNFLIEMVDR